jgi:hypothetical protein
MAVHTALERGECEHAEAELAEMTDVPPELAARVARQRGRGDEATRLIHEAMQSADGLQRIRLHISEATRMLEDYLPDEDGGQATDAAEALVMEISVDGLDAESRKKALVAIATLKHSIALNREDDAAAATIREQLESISGQDDPLLDDLVARSEVRLHGKVCFESTNPLRALSLRLMSLYNLPEEERLTTLQKVDLTEVCDTRLGRRLAAMVWTWRGMLEASERLACWREAIHLYTAAECPKAAKSLTHRLHSLLR